MSGGRAGIARMLRLRSPAELRDRSRQRLATWLERVSSSPNVREASDSSFASMLARDVPADADGVFRHFRTGSCPGIFAAFDNPSGVAEIVRSQFSEAAAKIVARARRAVRDRFDVFGREGLSYGDPIDWHLDPLRRRRAPRVHWSRVTYLDVESVGDHKVIWELNRHQHLITLAQAYWLTGDEVFAATVVRHVTEWMNANPPKIGINWSSSLELAFRAISWTWAFQLIRSSPTLTPAFVMRLMKYVHIHARHIAGHLSTYFSPNTHLTGEALGLLYVGTFFPELRSAPEWRELGWSILAAELEKQTWPDGVYFEQTTWYQRYTADFYLHAVRIRRRGGQLVSENVIRRLSKAIDPLVHFTRPDGTTPLIGDDDGGQLAPLYIGEANDFRATLALAAAMFGRGDCAALAGPAEAVLPWLIGPDELDSFHALDRTPPSDNSRLFADGGYFVARNRWSSDADYLLIDCGPHGALSCGHSHADALSLELSIHGVNLLVDPGTFSYAPPERDEFRTTAAHNTLVVDGAPSSIPDRPFNWKTATSATVVDALPHDRFCVFEGKHAGFERLADPVTHRRMVFGVFGRFFLILDRIAAKADHRLEARYHFAGDLNASVAPEGGIVVSRTTDALHAIADVCILGRAAAVRIETGRIAPSYGSLCDGPVLVVSASGTGTQELASIFVHRDGASSPAAAREIPTGSGRLVSIARVNGEDLIGWSDTGITNDSIDCDARWLWIRRDHDMMSDTEFILVAGSKLVVNGQVIVSLTHPRHFAFGRLGQNGWELETGPALSDR